MSSEQTTSENKLLHQSRPWPGVPGPGKDSSKVKYSLCHYGYAVTQKPSSSSHKDEKPRNKQSARPHASSSCKKHYHDGWMADCQRKWDTDRQFKMRTAAAQYQKEQWVPGPRPVNGDEENIPQFIGMFSKTLPHDGQGRVLPDAYSQLKDGLLKRDIKLLSTLPQPGDLKLVQPLAAFTINLTGPAASSLEMPPPPSMSSAETAAEMVELYWKVLFRDVPLDGLNADPLIAEAVEDLNKLKDYTANTPVTPHNIFRGTGHGELNGPFISQIMYIDTPMWPGDCPCQYYFPTRTKDNNRMVKKDTYLSVENGTVTESGPTLAAERTFITTGRDIAYSVWNDAPGQWYRIAVRRALHVGAKFSPKNPYLNPPLDKTMDSFVNWNQIDLTTCLETATHVAMTSAWYNKWCMFRRLRPEAFGNEMEQWRLSSSNPGKIDSQLLNSSVLNRIQAQQGNYYLAQVFQEGSPCHPSYPAGHAMFSGAGITIIKAFLQNDWKFPSPVIPSSDGKTLVPISADLTLAGELNKLASNVALGRDWAGVHYRTDGHQGILLGEKVAIQVLQDWLERYPEPDVCFKFTGYLGNEIVIKPRTNWGKQLNPYPLIKKRCRPKKCKYYSSDSGSDSDYSDSSCSSDKRNAVASSSTQQSSAQWSIESYPNYSDSDSDDSSQSKSDKPDHKSDNDSDYSYSDDTDPYFDDSSSDVDVSKYKFTQLDDWSSDDGGYRDRHQSHRRSNHSDKYKGCDGVSDRYRDGSYD